MIKRLKIVFMGVPMMGGNYTHFQYLSQGLNDFDWVLLQVGRLENECVFDGKFVNIGKEWDRKIHQKELAILLKNYLQENKVDIFIPMNSGIAISIIPFLSSSIQIINIVNSNTERVYKCVSEHLSYVSKIICISPIQINELGKKGISPNKLELIPHGVSEILSLKKEKNAIFKIGFLGRINHEQKGVLIVPEILKKITFPYVFEIVGDGQDKTKLLQLLEAKNISFIDYGFKIENEKEEIIQKWDSMLFPSHIEGFGLTLIECMKYGVIPVSNKLEGITDYIIEDKKDGFLVEKNSINAFVEKLNFLAGNFIEKEEMAKNAIQKVKDKFELQKILFDYKNVLEYTIQFQKPKEKTLEHWKEYKEYKPSLIDRILKNLFF